LIPALIFLMVSMRFLTNPARAAAASGLAAQSPLGLTNLRSGIGGLFLGSACVALFCLLSMRRLLFGLSFVATMLGVVLTVRIASVLIDHTAAASTRLLVVETVFLAVSLIGVFIESRRRYREQPSD
jgi:hypothetical protein